MELSHQIAIDVIYHLRYILYMEVVQIYKCLCDQQRLRILNLLREGPLCVCHLMEILDADQVKISKQLRYMKSLDVLECRREAQWVIYSLPKKQNPLLIENLKCLQDIAVEELRFAKDLRKRAQILGRLEKACGACPETVLKKNKR